MKNYIVTREQIQSMKHCIGFDNSKVTGTKYRKMKAYRNYYTTSEKKLELDKLVKQGLMIRRDNGYGCGYDPKIYFVTEEGFEFLSELTGIDIKEGD